MDQKPTPDADNGTNTATLPRMQQHSGAVPVGIWESFLSQPAVRRTIPLAALGAVVFIMIIIYMVISKASYRSLYPGIDNVDQAAVYDALSSSGIAVELDASNGAVKVPADQYHQARMFLAGKGLPKTSVGGMDMVREQQSLGTSQFIEQKRYQLAIEEELALSISTIDVVKAARVHLAIPKQSVFVRDRVLPKASVVLALVQGCHMSASQAQAIVNLVSSSVPYLEPDGVSIVDQFGNQLVEHNDVGGLGLNEQRLSYRNRLETIYEQRIEALLAPLVGASHLRTEVNAELDFTTTEMTQENYNPETVAVRSEQITQSTDRIDVGQAKGVPGALSNEPPVTPKLDNNGPLGETDNNTAMAGSPETKSVNSTRNYEVDKTIKHTRLPTGDLQRLSVSVVIDDDVITTEADGKADPSVRAEQLQGFESLVKNAVGFNAERGDSVLVITMAFQPQTAIPEQPFWQQPLVQNLALKGALVLLALVFILVILRPVFRNLINYSKKSQSIAAVEGQLGNSGYQVVDFDNHYNNKVDLVRKLVNEDSTRVAGVMSNWVRQDM